MIPLVKKAAYWGISASGGPVLLFAIMIFTNSTGSGSNSGGRRFGYEKDRFLSLLYLGRNLRYAIDLVYSDMAVLKRPSSIHPPEMVLMEYSSQRANSLPTLKRISSRASHSQKTRLARSGSEVEVPMGS